MYINAPSKVTFTKLSVNHKLPVLKTPSFNYLLGMITLNYSVQGESEGEAS